MIGEALAMVMGDTRIWSAGIYWEQNKFTNKTYFAPYAYKTQLNTRRFQVEDLARLNKTDELYLNQPWYKDLQARWGNYYEPLEKFWLKMYFRSEEQGDDIYPRRYEHFPEYYKAANIKQGLWTAPYYDCNGLVKMWKITYAAPFFGWDSLRNRIEFK
jgi:murein DD-endopeptidase MepM/ murein hydrolase activator NlpD